MSNTTAFPPTYTRQFGDVCYELTFEPSAPLHIPANYLPPEPGEEITWDFDGSPSLYQSHVLSNDYLDCAVIRFPATGKQQIYVEAAGYELTPDEAVRIADDLTTWVKGAVKSNGGEK